MSIENVEKFYEEIQKRTELSDQLKNADSLDSFIELAVKLGADNGFTFTPQDVAEVLEQKKTEVELSSQDLEAVAGGKGECYARTISLGVFRPLCFESVC